jgi:oligoendopeptidase F
MGIMDYKSLDAKELKDILENKLNELKAILQIAEFINNENVKLEDIRNKYKVFKHDFSRIYNYVKMKRNEDLTNSWYSTNFVHVIAEVSVNCLNAKVDGNIDDIVMSLQNAQYYLTNV